MDQSTFDRVSAAAQDSPSQAFAAVEAALKSDGEFHRLFDLYLMKARWELGLPLFLQTPASSWPKDQQEAYEPKVIDAARLVGGEFLKAGDLAAAFPYFNMIGELQPMRDALEAYEPKAEDDDLDPIVDLAIAHNAHPRRGLEIVVSRYGICQGITTMEQLLGQGMRSPEREDCIKVLVRSLHAELQERLSTLR